MNIEEVNKIKIKDALTSTYGVKSVEFNDLSYGTKIQLFGIDNFAFARDAIKRILNISNNTTLSILEENKKDLKATYVYLFNSNDKKIRK